MYNYTNLEQTIADIKANKVSIDELNELGDSISFPDKIELSLYFNYTDDKSMTRADARDLAQRYHMALLTEISYNKLKTGSNMNTSDFATTFPKYEKMCELLWHSEIGINIVNELKTLPTLEDYRAINHSDEKQLEFIEKYKGIINIVLN
jgi:hypothetical protein